MELRDKDGRTALLLAATKEDAAVLAMLLRRGADVHALDNRGYSALSLAAEDSPSKRAAEKLLAAGADVEQKTKDGCTPLILAAGKDYMPTVELLIEADEDVNATSDSGCTPLLCAARHCNAGVVGVLLELTGKSVDVNAADHKGRTALALAVSALAVSQRKDKQGRNVTPYSSRNREDKYRRVIDMLLDKHAKISKADVWGHTPLMHAIFGGVEQKLFDKLLSEVQNIDVLDNEGFTALHHAAWHGEVKVIKSLCAAGASPLVESQSKSLPVDMLRKEVESGDNFLRSYTNASQLVETDGLRSILNGISIVAVLIVTVTFIGLQTPPGGPSDGEGGQLKLAAENYEDMQEYKTHPVRINRAALRAYLVLDGLSLFWAATDLLLVLAFLLPGVSKQWRRLDQAAWVWCMLGSCSMLLALALVCAVGAYVAAGFTLLPAEEYYIMIIVASVGGAGLLIALFVLLYFVAAARGPDTCTFFCKKVVRGPGVSKFIRARISRYPVPPSPVPEVPSGGPHCKPPGGTSSPWRCHALPNRALALPLVHQRY